MWFVMYTRPLGCELDNNLSVVFLALFKSLDVILQRIKRVLLCVHKHSQSHGLRCSLCTSVQRHLVLVSKLLCFFYDLPLQLES